MVTFTCPKCNQVRTGQRRRCYPCTIRQSPESRAKIAAALTGVPHPPERRARNAERGRRQAAAGRVFDIGATTRGKPARNAVPVGTERVVKDGRVQVKCDDGKWRYRSRLVWEQHNGPIPHGGIIHHHDEDPMNDHLDNLRLVTRAEHARLHADPEKMRRMQRASAAARRPAWS